MAHLAITVPSRVNGKQNPEYFKRYYSKKRDHIRILQKQWRRLNPTYSRLCNLDYRKMVVNLLRQRDGDWCELCGEKMVFFTIDHIEQRAIGGTDAAENLRLLHLKCNQAREKPRSG